MQSFAHTFGMISVEASAFPASRNSPGRYFSQPIRIRLPRFFKIYLYCRGQRPLKVQVLVWRMFPFRVVL
ncbi:MAG TPA: hypothetical protein DHE23_02045 [Agrobacterium sp.]|nr:hypothetical protein [Agrobacterium sp.]